MGKLKKKWKEFWAYNPNYDVQNRELVDFGIGVCGQNHAYNLISGWFEWFSNMVMKIDPLTTGMILGVARAWDAINDPLAGSIIDKHVFKNGEKLRPYIRYISLPIGILTALMFTNFGFEKEAAKICYMVAIYFLWDTVYSFQDIAQWGMVARITNQPERREKAAYAGRVGGMVGGWLPGLISLIIGLSADGVINVTYTQLFIMFGIVFGVGGMAMSMWQLKCKERAPAKSPEGNIFEGFKLLKSNKIVKWLALASVAGSITFVLSGTYFFQFMINITIGGKVYNGLNIMFVWGIVTGLPGVVAMLFTPVLAKKVGGMQRILLIATLTNITCRLLAYFIGYQGYKLIFLALFQMIISIPNSMTGIASTALWSDSLDYVEWKTGKRNEGTVFAMQNFIAKMTGSIGLIMSGITLNLLKFQPKSFVNADGSDMTTQEIIAAGLISAEFTRFAWPIYILAPAIGSIFYLIPLLMLKYPKEEREQVMHDISLKREQERLEKMAAEGLEVSSKANENVEL